jgi:hypothetical protein
MGKNFSLHDLVILKAVCEFVSTMWCLIGKSFKARL